MTETKTRCHAGGRPPACEIEERRQHLVAVATRLFLSKGYEATSLENIAKAAGASKTTIYRNFGDKADLFRIIFNGYTESLWPTLSDVQTEGKSPREVLTAVGALMISQDIFSPDSVALMRLIYHEAPRFPELTRIFGEIEQTVVDVVAGYLRSAQRRNQLRLTDPEWSAIQFLELIWGILSHRVLVGLASQPDDAERRRIVESSVDLFLNGTLAPGRHPQGDRADKDKTTNSPTEKV
ncbi:TetR/AcrR family transcriptional regulator [Telmatospirillum siberiense]|uniref:HTH tetR-type domain-containing protein n=1 Tax=Telmatospirillum siberiense TaxID=382514 RepID=A0A2N3PZ67_9PROT|nr:TetR/AcrR family transcriptional regulator [Telmatospirillum siberiense]PKU25700.1 hypothetical protein CWS72_03755 [Telmatospirillum siberiense]